MLYGCVVIFLDCQVDPLERPAGLELVQPTVGCAVGDAWIGLDLGAGNPVEQVWRRPLGWCFGWFVLVLRR